VRDRQIEYDLKFLVAVLAWAEGADEKEPHHLPRNPWSRERRKSQKMIMARERNPKRPSMTQELHEALVDQAPNWRFAGVMELCRETMHRRNSVRQLRWEDIDLQRETVEWRGEYDKNGREIIAPLTPRAMEVLDGLPQVPGSPWLFPAEEDVSRPVTRHTLDTWLKRAKERAGIEIEGLGFHGQKRAGVRRKEFRALPNPVREKLTGTSARTLDSVYDDVSVDEMRDALQQLNGGS
jgi:integrase